MKCYILETIFATAFNKYHILKGPFAWTVSPFFERFIIIMPLEENISCLLNATLN